MTADQIEFEAIFFECEFLCAENLDKENLLIKNVPLCGNKSGNGYSIPPEAFRSESHVKKIYEGKHVYLDHNFDERGRLRSPHTRSIRDLAGTVESARFDGKRPRGDIRCTHTEAGRFLFGLAQSKVNNVGMSHVAAYEWNSDRSSVNLVKEIGSVDAVINPATTKTFAESRRKDQMDPNDKLIENLESKNTELSGKNTDLKSENDKLKAKVQELESQIKSLKEEVEKSAESSKELKAKVDEFETKEAIAARRTSVVESLKKNELDPEDEVQVSKIFFETLMDISDDEKRNAMIADRAETVKLAKDGKSKGGGGGASSYERREPKDGKDGDKFNAESDWSDEAFAA